MNYSSLTPAFQLSIRAALSAGLAVAIAELLRLEYPLYDAHPACLGFRHRHTTRGADREFRRGGRLRLPCPGQPHRGPGRTDIFLELPARIPRQPDGRHLRSDQEAGATSLPRRWRTRRPWASSTTRAKRAGRSFPDRPGTGQLGARLWDRVGPRRQGAFAVEASSSPQPRVPPGPPKSIFRKQNCQTLGHGDLANP